MKTVLIIDDNKDILMAIEKGLCMYLKGCSILTAENGKTAGEIIDTQPVDLVLADLDMPVMDGYRFIEQARKEHASLPVCAMTGYCTQDIRDRLSALGVRQVLGKPFDLEHLAQVISGELGLEQQGQA